MTKEEAYTLLSFHSCRNNDIENEKWENGFLGSLRPFQGKLYECNFIEIMECLKVLADDFMKPTIKQTLLSDVYSIIHLGKRWIDGADFVTQEQQKQIIETMPFQSKFQDSFILNISHGYGREFAHVGTSAYFIYRLQGSHI